MKRIYAQCININCLDDDCDLIVHFPKFFYFSNVIVLRDPHGGMQMHEYLEVMNQINNFNQWLVEDYNEDDYTDFITLLYQHKKQLLYFK